MYKRLLTIQDVSCVGQCSATVALPVVSACGVECAVLPSAVLSNHTGGFTGWTFRDLTGDMDGIAAEWARQKLKFDAFYTGYVLPSQIDPILRIMESAANPGALRIIDPVLGDHGKLYAGFGGDFPARMRRLCEGADFITPNLTEAALLLGREPVLEGYGRDFVEKTLDELHGLGAKNVVLTGVSFEPELLGTAVSDGREVRYDFNPRITHFSHGTGDLFASAFSGALLRGLSLFAAAELAADIVCAALKATPEGHWYGPAFELAIPELVRRIER